MTTTLTLSTRADVLATIPRVLGFLPSDSLIVLGVGDTPTARVDMPHDEAERDALAVALAPATVQHWSGQTVLVVGYTYDSDSFDRLDFGALLPGARVADSFRYTGGTIFGRHDPTGVQVEPSEVAGLDALPEPKSSRECLVMEAQQVTDPDEAARLAWQFYKDGNGALAWVYVDRAVALGADITSDDLAPLTALLVLAVNPLDIEHTDETTEAI